MHTFSFGTDFGVDPLDKPHMQPQYSHRSIRPKNMRRFSVDFGGVLNLVLLLTQGGNGVSPEEMIELRGLVELPVVDVTGTDCTVLETAASCLFFFLVSCTFLKRLQTRMSLANL